MTLPSALQEDSRPFRDLPALKALRHEMLQPAAIAMMMLETVKERNTDDALKPPLQMLEQALSELARLIATLP